MEAYAVKHKKHNVRLASRSGGAFVAISDVILENHGVVYGCAFNQDLEAVHIRATDKNERNRMCGSRYVQSRMGDMFRKVEEDLITGVTVLFSGTPCQVAGLKAYLNHAYDNLLTIDILCMGVPSPLIYKDYKTLLEKRYNGTVVDYKFRNIKYGWRSSIDTVVLNVNGKKKTINSRELSTIYYSHITLRPSCFKCPYKGMSRNGNISLGDCWGIEKENPQFDDDYGVSLVLVNDAVGKCIVDKIKEDVNLMEIDINNCMQSVLCPSYEAAPRTREEFWKDYKTMDFGELMRKYTYNTTGTVSIRMKKQIELYKYILKKNIKHIIWRIK